MKILKEYYEPEFDKRTQKIKYLYHTVFSHESYEFVKKYGIKKDIQGFVYLSEKPIIKDSKEPWAVNNTVAVFKVTIPDNNKLYDWREFWWDDEGNEIDLDHQYEPDNPWYIYLGDIPLKYLEEIKL